MHNYTHSSSPMNMRSAIITGAVISLLFPAGLSATRPAPKQYQSVEGTFETQEEAEAACMRAVGFDERAIRIFTGNIGSLWQADDPLRFYVRRCLNNLRKREENRIIGERREGRVQERMRKKMSPYTQRRIESNKRLVRDRTYENLRRRTGQHTRGAERQVRTYEDIRSTRRVTIRAKERRIRKKLNRRNTFRKEAQRACLHKRGTQRVMCIRQEIRGQEEELYNNGK